MRCIEMEECSFNIISQSSFEIAMVVKDEPIPVGDDVLTVEEPILVANDVVHQYLDDILVLEDIDNKLADTDFGLVETDDLVVAALEPFLDNSESCVSENNGESSCGGLRAPDFTLVEAGKGKEKSASYHNDRWSLRRVNKLRSELGWDLSIAFGDLPLDEVDELLSILFTRVCKVNGDEYSAESLVNMLGGYNRLIRKASEVRSLKGNTATGKHAYRVEPDFNIKKHPLFSKTRMVLTAAIKKSAREGSNKRRDKVEILTDKMEEAMIQDIDHQITTNDGCQKLLAFFLLVRLGIRGGKELWNLQRNDLSVMTTRHGREYVRFEERESKNNSYSLNRTKEEQFRKTYYSYEPRFVMCLKQYMRHMPPMEECKPNLFLGCIHNPASIVWYNRANKVGRDKAAGWLKSMLGIVGLPTDMFSNKSGRATLIIRMAAQGVPDEVGTMVTGHHTTDGYLRYDRTQGLKMEAVVVVSANPNVSYHDALAEVAKSYVREKIVGCDEGLKPLIGLENCKALVPMDATKSNTTLMNRISGTTSTLANNSKEGAVAVADKFNHAFYDGIKWEEELQSNPILARALGGRLQPVSIGNEFSGTFHGCTINIICKDEKKGAAEGKENECPLK